MSKILQSEVLKFAALAVMAGWEWCGFQEAIPPVLPVLIIQKWGIIKRIPFNPENFDPIKLAKQTFASEENKMTDTPKLNLRQKMIQIYNEIDHVEKAGRNQKQNYNFVRAADVMRPIRDGFAKYGIYAETNYELLGTYDIKTNSGGNMHTATVKATIVLHDADSDETLTISGLGDGADSGDKGVYKAMTGATKNALRNGTLLPDEADPEADENVDDRTDPKPFTPAWGGPKNQPEPTIAECLPPNEDPGATAVAGSPAPVSASPEHGDAYEGPDNDGSLPNEEELTAYRKQFSDLGTKLKGELKTSDGLPVNRKLLTFLMKMAGVDNANKISKAGWDNFFTRVEAAKAKPEVGLVGIAKMVNKANGIEEK